MPLDRRQLPDRLLVELVVRRRPVHAVCHAIARRAVRKPHEAVLIEALPAVDFDAAARKPDRVAAGGNVPALLLRAVHAHIDRAVADLAVEPIQIIEIDREVDCDRLLSVLRLVLRRVACAVQIMVPSFRIYYINLIPTLNAVENVELPLIYRGIKKSARRQMALNALEKVGLEKRITHRPFELSGGQQQRVAIARAIASEPEIILADEPTGNLDANSSKDIMDILKNLHKQGATVVLITHDKTVADMAERQIEIFDGEICS